MQPLSSSVFLCTVRASVFCRSYYVVSANEDCLDIDIREKNLSLNKKPNWCRGSKWLYKLTFSFDGIWRVVVFIRRWCTSRATPQITPTSTKPIRYCRTGTQLLALDMAPCQRLSVRDSDASIRAGIGMRELKPVIAAPLCTPPRSEYFPQIVGYCDKN